MHLITLFRIMNPHQRCLQVKSNSRMSQKQVMPKSEDLSRSLEINAIWTFDTEFPTIFNKSCTYITFKSAIKHRQTYPRFNHKSRYCVPVSYFYLVLHDLRRRQNTFKIMHAYINTYTHLCEPIHSK